VLESYLNCKYKGHLKLTGQRGVKCDYETLLMERRAEVRLRFIEKILARHPGEELLRNLPLTTSALKEGASFFLDGSLEDDLVALEFDGLKKVDGPSKLGDFHYIPILFHERRTIRREQRLLLDVYAFFLSRLQGRVPSTGLIWHGTECKATKVRLNTAPRKAEHILQDLKGLARAQKLPQLILNDHCQVCEFRRRCHELATQEDTLSLLHGMTEKEIARQKMKGIFTVTQLSYTFRTRRQRKRVKCPAAPHHLALQALAIREKKIFVHGNPVLACRPTRAYLDIEGHPDSQSYYLIGLVAIHNGVESRHSFWADDESEQVKIFSALLDQLHQFPDYSLLHYGSYEISALRRMKKHLPDDYQQPVTDAIMRSINVLSIISPHIYFPTFSNSLKDLGHHAGCTWSDPSASGLQSIVWRTRWRQGRDESIKQKLVQYNLEDCLALRKVTEFIEDLIKDRDPTSQDPAHSTSAVHTSTLFRPKDSRPVFKKAIFALEDFAAINECAYFDYQRDRVFGRSCDCIKKASRIKKKRRSVSYRPNKLIEIAAARCPSCGSRKITPLGQLSRSIIDLKFFGSGVKRWVVRYVSWRYGCPKCSSTFIPQGFPNSKTKYGRGLVSWCIYQHVVRGQNMFQVGKALPDLFGLHSSRLPLHRFKIAVAEYYHVYYEGLLAEILSSPILHIDETEVDLRAKKGYVWVITSMSAVFYFYKDSREGTFLQEMLKEFKGVLISDFYTAYDSLQCSHQRCLIHLMRDLNEDLLKNAFDVEFRELTGRFAVLLKAIVSTIDQYGLKKRHLHKHKTAVSGFFRWVGAKAFSSEIAQKYQKRFQKYEGMLFTFLDHDGVPWNNNNAEHAMKAFAKHRRFADGRFTEQSIQEYLVILSVYQTCEYRGVSFLKFLLDGPKDGGLGFGSGKRKAQAEKPEQDGTSVSAVPQEASEESPVPNLGCSLS
jgi:predicted RecB family nuclease